MNINSQNQEETTPDHRDLFWYGAIILTIAASIALMYRSFTDEDTFYRAEILNSAQPAGAEEEL